MADSQKQVIKHPDSEFEVEVETIRDEAAFHFRSKTGKPLFSFYAAQSNFRIWWENAVNEANVTPTENFIVGMRVHGDETLITSNGLLAKPIRKADGFK